MLTFALLTPYYLQAGTVGASREALKASLQNIVDPTLMLYHFVNFTLANETITSVLFSG